MMSLVKMVLLLLSFWLVCHTFVSSNPAVSSANRLYGRRESADRNLRHAVPSADDDSSSNSADFNSLPKSSDDMKVREAGDDTDTEGTTGTWQTLPIVGRLEFRPPIRVNRSLDWDPQRITTPTNAQ